jgi:hypothetical protein
MMSRKGYDTQHVPLRQNTERKKYEGRGEKRRRETRTDETRKWDEGPRGEVERNEWRPSLPRL